MASLLWLWKPKAGRGLMGEEGPGGGDWEGHAGGPGPVMDCFWRRGTAKGDPSELGACMGETPRREGAPSFGQAGKGWGKDAEAQLCAW